MVSFIGNGSDKQLGWGIASKPKAENPKQHFQDKNIFLEFQAVHKDTEVVRQFTKTATFIATPMKKHSAVCFTKGCFLVDLLTEKLWVYCQNITCLLEIGTSQKSIFFFT